MVGELEFERPILELKQKIAQLHQFMDESGLDLSDELAKLQQQMADLSEKVYEGLSAWQRVQLARQPGRPTTLDYIQGMCTDFIELHGDRNFRDDPAIVGGVALLDGKPITVIGHQKGRDTKENIHRNFGMANPEGYRKALRLMKQAEKFHRPVIFFIDTAGAYPGMSGEERGISESIATNLRVMAGLKTQTICFVLGEGGSGGALGLGVTDRIYPLEYAWYSVIAPESAAAILWKDSTQAERAAETMRIGARDLYELGIADDVLSEPPGGAQKDPQAMIERVRDKAIESLTELSQLSLDALLEARYDKYRKIGEYAE